MHQRQQSLRFGWKTSRCAIRAALWLTTSAQLSYCNQNDLNPDDMNHMLHEDPHLLHSLGHGCDDSLHRDPDADLGVAAVYEVPRLSWDSPCVGIRLRKRLPVVILDADLVPTASKWCVVIV